LISVSHRVAAQVCAVFLRCRQQRANGSWEGRLTYTDTDTGRIERASFYAPTAKAAPAKMKAARDRLDAGAPVKDATQSVADWLAHWRATTLASDRKESTRALCGNLCRRHLEPAPFGAIPLDKLKPSDVEASAPSECRRGGPGPLPKTAPDLP
jgi:hypothetical protein